MPEVVGDAGLVVAAEDVEAWADGIQRALEPAESARLVAAGGARVGGLTWAGSAATVSRLLSSIH